MVLDLSLRQRGFLNRGPHHRLGPLVERTVHHKGLEFLRDHALGVEIHRQIGLIPVARDPEPLEFFALDINPTACKIPTFLTEFNDIHGVLITALLAVLFLDLPLDGQTVAVPAGDVARIAALHLLRTDNHILKDFVQRVADVEVAVGIGRAVVQRKGLAARALAQLAIYVKRLPACQPLGLTLGQARTHRKIRFWQVQGVFVVKGCVGGLGGHRASS